MKRWCQVAIMTAMIGLAVFTNIVLSSLIYPLLGSGELGLISKSLLELGLLGVVLFPFTFLLEKIIVGLAPTAACALIIFLGAGICTALEALTNNHTKKHLETAAEALKTYYQQLNDQIIDQPLSEIQQQNLKANLPTIHLLLQSNGFTPKQSAEALSVFFEKAYGISTADVIQFQTLIQTLIRSAPNLQEEYDALKADYNEKNKTVSLLSTDELLTRKDELTRLEEQLQEKKKMLEKTRKLQTFFSNDQNRKCLTQIDDLKQLIKIQRYYRLFLDRKKKIQLLTP